MMVDLDFGVTARRAQSRFVDEMLAAICLFGAELNRVLAYVGGFVDWIFATRMDANTHVRIFNGRSK